MLSNEQHAELAKLFQLLAENKNKTNVTLEFSQVVWMASKLQDMDAELRTIYKPTVDKLIKEIFPRNPLSYEIDGKTVILAFLEGDGYRCVFCNAIRRDELNAINHGKTHLARKG